MQNLDFQPEESNPLTPKRMVVHYLLSHRHECEFQIRPIHHSEVAEYLAEFKAKGAKVYFDPASGLLTISHSKKLGSLLSSVDIWEDRKTFLAGCGLWFGRKVATLMLIIAAVAIGAEAFTDWFSLLACLCIGGAIFERKDRKTRIIMAIVFATVAALGFPWSKWLSR